MPKDLIHFKVAEMAAARLKDTHFAPALQGCHPWLLLGSVFHDALFYGVTRQSRPMALLAHALHGAHGQDTYTLIRMQAAHASQTKSMRAAALLVGMISHLFADAVMHPMVWHFSGHYYADSKQAKTLARQTHRALESLMDMVTCPEMKGRPLYTVHRLLKKTDKNLSDALPIDGLSKLAHVSPGEGCRGVNTAFQIYAGFQKAFSYPLLSRTLFAIMPGMPAPVREIIALFYAPQLMEQASRLHGNIEYSHPVTGVTSTESLNDMMERGAEQAATLCRKLEGAVFLDQRLEIPEHGPSMDAGIPRLPVDAMRHFSRPPFPTLP